MRARLALVLCALACSGCGVVRGLTYPAPEGRPPAMPAAFARLEACAHDGAAVRGYWLPPPDGQARVVVLLHGNGETMENRAGLALDLWRRGLGVALVEYRGYGLSRGAGRPDERGLYLDAAAVLEALYAVGIAKERIVLVGISLGTGVAAQMAACGAAGALVLVSPFTSLVDEAAAIVPWLPVSWLVADRFDTLGKAGRIEVPTLVIHGEDDEIIPVDMGRRVAAAIPRATFVAVPGGHHNDLLRVWRRPLLDRIEGFLARVPLPESR